MSSESFSNFVEKNGAFLLTITSVFSGCISGLFVYILKSRCRTINCCWGGFTCARDVIPSAELNTITMSSSPPSVSSADVI